MNARPGLLVGVVGPSGAGKDTLIERARQVLAGDPDFLFVRRLVTRPSNVFEDHDSLSEADFERRTAAGKFPLWWRAHCLGYAVPASTTRRIDAGTIAVCNLSRAILPASRARFTLRVPLMGELGAVVAFLLTECDALFGRSERPHG